MKPSEWQEIASHLEQMLGTLKFGSITLVVQDGKVIQIEKNEKVRLQSNKRAD
ncbi:YezD family protein [Neobacillus pocheonensis]